MPARNDPLTLPRCGGRRDGSLPIWSISIIQEKNANGKFCQGRGPFRDFLRMLFRGRLPQNYGGRVPLGIVPRHFPDERLLDLRWEVIPGALPNPQRVSRGHFSPHPTNGACAKRPLDTPPFAAEARSAIFSGCCSRVDFRRIMEDGSLRGPSSLHAPQRARGRSPKGSVPRHSPDGRSFEFRWKVILSALPNPQ